MSDEELIMDGEHTPAKIDYYIYEDMVSEKNSEIDNLQNEFHKKEVEIIEAEQIIEKLKKELMRYETIFKEHNISIENH